MPYQPVVTPTAPLQPSAVQPVANQGMASEVELYTLYQRPIPEQFDLFARHIQYVGFATMLRAMGFSRMISTPTTGHFEEPWLHDLLTIGAIQTAAVNPGDSAVIDLDAADLYDTGVQSNVPNNNNRASYPVKGDVIELPDRTQAYISQKDVSSVQGTHRLTLVPLKTTGDISGIQVADQYGIIYNLWGEGSNLPDGRVPRIFKYTNTLGLVKHSFGSTGHELTNSVYHEVIPGNPGSRGDSIYVKIKRDDLIRFEHSKSGMLVFGQTADNIVETNNIMNINAPISSTEGFVEFARTAGNQDTYSLGGYSFDELDNVARLLLNERSAATNDVMGWLGPEIWTEIENNFTNTLTQNLIYTVDRIIDGYAGYANTQYHQSLTKDGTDATLSFGYSAFRKNGFIFHIKRLSEFNDTRRLGGETDYTYRSWAIWHPLSWSKDQLSGSSRPTIGYEYKGLGNYSRESMFGHLPGAGVGGDNSPYGRAVNEWDSMRYFLMGHCGFHGATANAIVVQRPV